MNLQIRTFDHMGNKSELWPQDRKVRTEILGHLLSAEYRDGDSLSCREGRVHSLTHCTRKSADWGAFSYKTQNKASPETLPGVVLKTSYRHLLQSLHQKEACRDPTAEVATEDVWKTFES